ncbi:phosphotransferase enzyme family protein [Streptomyces sp. URMC 123]|uniref:phosphotransferase enzyme family protein n=1 Tax=Streptomyces sp. URMC 123 TaxID=3423403 RepID=UPI003F1D9ACD
MPFATTTLSDRVRDTVHRAWGLALDLPAERLYGGEESAAYRFGDLVVRLGPPWRPSAEAEWCHRVALAAAGAGVTEAVAPLRTVDGATVVRLEGRPVTLWPHVAGEWVAEGDPDAAGRAARLLARLHRAVADLELPARPGPSHLAVGLAGDETYDDPALRDPALDRWLAEFHRTAERRHPLHGDYHHGNLLADGDGRITAVLDWDDALVAPPEAELASAALEFGDEYGRDLAAVRAFVDAYHAEGGTAGDLDDEALAQLMRHRLRREGAYFDLARARGAVHGEEGLEHHRLRMAAFAALRP